MFTRKAFLVSIGILASACISAQETPKLGVPASAADVAGWDISISPDGAGLPPGSGTAVQGKAIYELKCIACHGADGQGQINDRLAGGHGTLTSESPVKTIGSYWPYATTVFDYVRRAMSLTDEEAYALTAYLLAVNGIIDEGEQMNATTLPRVEMPNRDNFVWAYQEP